MERNTVRFYRKYKGLHKKIFRNTEWKPYTGLSFWVQADLKSMKETLYDIKFKFLYQVMPNFLTIISFSSF